MHAIHSIAINVDCDNMLYQSRAAFKGTAISLFLFARLCVTMGHTYLLIHITRGDTQAIMRN